MRTRASSLALFFVMASTASANSVICDSNDVHDPINATGVLTITLSPFSAINQKNGVSTPDTIYASQFACGRNTTTLAVIPSCETTDASGTNFIKYSTSCNQKYADGTQEWFSEGGLVVSSNGSGQFDCHLSDGEQATLLELTNCKTR
jgi:hypothetical protein